ncbi:transposase [Sedimenticola hydrogenitrophicus]|uniref:transposase n=1 Tax=Sedimenticola hydrogenitrophicus TaxID=2967975 RepID=UPI0023AE88E5|nr:transposase [Sedimenticola hydrogenitrophicus]
MDMTKPNSPKPHRRSLRLRGYDYSQAGAYFVTICTRDRLCLFGEIVDGVMHLNSAGEMIQSIWNEIPLYYPGTEVDKWVIMPNHMHGILGLVGAGPRACPDRAPSHGSRQRSGPARLSLPDLVHRFKSLATKRYIDGVKQSGWPPFPGQLWQRNYWERIIRDEAELDLTREYIRNNPAQWELDQLYVGIKGQPRGVAPTDPAP